MGFDPARVRLDRGDQFRFLVRQDSDGQVLGAAALTGHGITRSWTFEPVPVG